MKILYLTISYNAKGQGLYNDLVDSLINDENDVTIVRASGEKDCKDVVIMNDHLNLIKVDCGNPFESNLIKKGFNQVLLDYQFKKTINKYLSKNEFDLILYATPPVTLAGCVEYCKKKYNAKTFLMLKDIFPQNAVDLEMIKKNGVIYKYFRRKEMQYYKYSDKIGCMSQGNINYVIEHNPEVDTNKLCLFPNAINVNTDRVTKFNTDKTVFMFGGNLGKPQNIKYLLEVIYELNDYDLAEFIIMGKGAEVPLIKEFIALHELKHFKYFDELPQNEYEDYLEKADVGLISLDPRFTIPNIPSRFQTYLRLKKPVLAITDVNTDLKEMIEDHECGWWCEAGNLKVSKSTVKFICENKKTQLKYGENGYKYLINEFDISNTIDTLLIHDN